MAALTLNEQQLNKSLISKKQKNKKPSTKAVLCYPYVAKWPPVESDTQQNIMKQIKQCFEVQDDEVKVVVNSDMKSSSNGNKGRLPKPQHRLRRFCVCGINRVTRHLERDELQLVIVDRSSPWQLHQHLAQLSTVRQCKAVAIDNLSSVLSPLLSVTRLCAVGFKKELLAEGCTKLPEMVKEVISMCPSIDLPWLECDSYLRTLKASRVEENMREFEEKLNESCVPEERKPVDYSHLYVYKKDRPVVPTRLANDYIMLASSDDDDKYTDDDDDDYGNDDNNEIKFHHNSNDAPTLKRKYVSANVGLQQANVEKKRKKKIKAKKGAVH